MTSARSTITVTPGPRRPVPFEGIGFHVFCHLHPMTDRQSAEVFDKRWREMNPSYARLTHYWNWDLARVLPHLHRLRQTGTQMYLTTWDPPDVPAGPPRDAYAARVGELLESLVRGGGCDHLTTYCMTNEMSLRRWGDLRDEPATFADYHTRIHAEIARRRLPVGLLASDASPIQRWDTVEWAAEHMDAITAVYGGHHYLNEHPPHDPTACGWLSERLAWAARLAGRRGKGFVIGEIGAAQYKGPPIEGKNHDACRWWDTPAEPLVAVQLAEIAVAAINAGISAVCYWTFADFPDTWRPDAVNKWGTFRWTGRDHSPRPHYDPTGQLTRFFRGPADPATVTADDPLIRAAAVRHRDGDTWSLVIVSRHDDRREVRIDLPPDAPGRGVRVCRYAAGNPRIHPFGDLSAPADLPVARNGPLRVELEPASVTVLTTVGSDTGPPPAPARVQIAPGAQGSTLTWEPVGSAIYYRVHAAGGAGQLASTTATAWPIAPDAPARLAVSAVDVNGRCSRPAPAEVFPA